MNERIKQLLSDMETKRLMAKNYMDGEAKDVDKALALLDEADKLEKEYDAEKRLADLQKEEASQKAAAEKAKVKGNADNGISETAKAFLAGVKSRFKDYDGMREGSDVDGGYIVPQDIVTQIKQFKRAEFSLLPLVDYNKVTTNKGSRTYESKATATSFGEMDEAGVISKIENVNFQVITYSIKNFGGFLPVSNQLDQRGYETQGSWRFSYLLCSNTLEQRGYENVRGAGGFLIINDATNWSGEDAKPRGEGRYGL